MVNVRLVGVTKRFGKLEAVRSANLQMSKGEFFTMLGPSGCGKTTTLRIIAGFYTPDEGEVYFDDRLMNYVAVWKRNIGMVFQNYALWPHMNVEENVAYGLRMRKIGKKETEDRVKKSLDLVGLATLERRYPTQLSGGQQQRVALARALVIEPSVLLLDEPLSNLDAKIRASVRSELRRLQQQLKITTIYVTHDQEEALVLSDRIAVMDRGLVQQISTPRELYEKPETSFVADFMGTSNFIKGTLAAIRQDRGLVEVETSSGLLAALGEERLRKGEKVILSVRPEDVIVLEQGRDMGEQGLNRIEGQIKFASYMGSLIRYEAVTKNGEIFKIDLRNPREHKVMQQGEHVTLAFKPTATLVIPLEHGEQASSENTRSS